MQTKIKNLRFYLWFTNTAKTQIRRLANVISRHHTRDQKMIDDGRYVHFREPKFPEFQKKYPLTLRLEVREESRRRAFGMKRPGGGLQKGLVRNRFKNRSDMCQFEIEKFEKWKHKTQ